MYGPPKVPSKRNECHFGEEFEGPVPGIGIELLLLALRLSRILLLYIFLKNHTIKFYNPIGICYIKCYGCPKHII